MRDAPRLAALLGLCLLSVPAAAQRNAANGSDARAPIIVNGRPITREQARERAASFVRQTGVARSETPVARWTDPVCPRVIGIDEAYADRVEARMRAIGETAGVRLAPPGCQPNVVVSFVGDARALMGDIVQRAPRRLAQVPPDLRDDLVNGDAPIRWWYLTETRTREQMRDTPRSVDVESERGGPQGFGRLEVESLNQFSSSVISTQAGRAIIDAQVVIDLRGVEGQPLMAVAAFAAFVAFAEVRPSAPPPPDSILGLVAPNSGLRGLTEWDSAFLRALYQIPLDRGALRHRGALVSEMVAFQVGR